MGVQVSDPSYSQNLCHWVVIFKSMTAANWWNWTALCTNTGGPRTKLRTYHNIHRQWCRFLQGSLLSLFRLLQIRVGLTASIGARRAVAAFPEVWTRQQCQWNKEWSRDRLKKRQTAIPYDYNITLVERDFKFRPFNDVLRFIETLQLSF